MQARLWLPNSELILDRILHFVVTVAFSCTTGKLTVVRERDVEDPEDRKIVLKKMIRCRDSGSCWG